MTEREALLKAVVDSPDDDTPKLVFADFLDETGNTDDAEWAAFIRVKYPLSSHYRRGNREECDRNMKLTRKLLSSAVPLAVTTRIFVEDTPGCERWAEGRHLSECRDWGSLGRAHATFFGDRWVVAVRHGFIVGVMAKSRRFVQCAPAVFRSHPVQWATVLGPFAESVARRRYGPVRDSGPTTDGYYWSTWRTPGQNVSALPDEIFKLLLGGRDADPNTMAEMEARYVELYQHGRFRVYDSRDEAEAAFADACVAYGRKSANLAGSTAA